MYKNFLEKNSVKKPSANWFILISFGILIIVLGFSIFQHELVHSQINAKAGVESELKFGLYDGWIPAIDIQRLNAPTKEISNYDALHLQNEIINYNLFPSLIGITMAILIGFFYIGEKIEGVKKK